MEGHVARNRARAFSVRLPPDPPGGMRLAGLSHAHASRRPGRLARPASRGGAKPALGSRAAGRFCRGPGRQRYDAGPADPGRGRRDDRGGATLEDGPGLRAGVCRRRARGPVAPPRGQAHQPRRISGRPAKRFVSGRPQENSVPGPGSRPAVRVRVGADDLSRSSESNPVDPGIGPLCRNRARPSPRGLHGLRVARFHPALETGTMAACGCGHGLHRNCVDVSRPFCFQRPVAPSHLPLHDSFRDELPVPDRLCVPAVRHGRPLDPRRPHGPRGGHERGRRLGHHAAMGEPRFLGLPEELRSETGVQVYGGTRHHPVLRNVHRRLSDLVRNGRKDSVQPALQRALPRLARAVQRNRQRRDERSVRSFRFVQVPARGTGGRLRDHAGDVPRGDVRPLPGVHRF